MPWSAHSTVRSVLDEQRAFSIERSGPLVPLTWLTWLAVRRNHPQQTSSTRTEYDLGESYSIHAPYWCFSPYMSTAGVCQGRGIICHKHNTWYRPIHLVAMRGVSEVKTESQSPHEEHVLTFLAY
ncbi:hypothetical protein PV04_09891 [Phialophora macrospora]|uniref:Uncharacterized protein n=1 Tax=Phialophora macrospora TaxID=1851006 RepID=A0A0D2FSK0_9EURO|nr:hypothetical protein PV04_09891 [Phialophora macrospora]